MMMGLKNDVNDGLTSVSELFVEITGKQTEKSKGKLGEYAWSC
jgi:hypothetical protein